MSAFGWISTWEKWLTRIFFGRKMFPSSPMWDSSSIVRYNIHKKELLWEILDVGSSLKHSQIFWTLSEGVPQNPFVFLSTVLKKMKSPSSGCFPCCYLTNISTTKPPSSTSLCTVLLLFSNDPESDSNTFFFFVPCTQWHHFLKPTCWMKTLPVLSGEGYRC